MKRRAAFGFVVVHAVSVVAVLALFASASQAQNVLSFESSSSTVSLGNQFSVDLNMDFAQSTSGGGFEIGYDPGVLNLANIAFDSGFPGDPDFSCPGSTAFPCPASPFVSFGSFGGVVGSHTVVSLLFDAIGLGTSAISAAIVNDFDDGSGNVLGVGVTPTSVQVVPVPEPGTGCLVGLGLFALGAIRRHP